MSPLPAYYKKPIPRGKNFFAVQETIKTLELETVCQEAGCPNRGECWSRGAATFLILGKNCTRNCRFCSVEKGVPFPLDPLEHKKIAQAVSELNLKYAVITSVTRDDLENGGASQFAMVIREIHWGHPSVKVEALIPDFKGSALALDIVIDARPEVLAHNIETVPRLYPKVRSMANYKRSLEVLRMAKIIKPNILTKSGLILGFGETKKEIMRALRDLRRADCDLVTIGQYLAPSEKHTPVERFLPPDEFDEFGKIALELGFRGVASAPLVRSSYRAEELLDKEGG